ncbi:diacylglycerol kinase family lipid kinase [Thermomicrobium sp. 4228-Ro]|uniref:diacylglycerol/lipid kinase family protein n=1 Tax=Thermomicrobium sp. 4228-Ro TaxID=2993937 RepID=UPI0022489070|nr:diacylglycerol kinase family protein [Thermomicrobium sp. 4228-Ro]MCX2727256.1 diacylglycerol kinase family lipid kinase [Thermomicrobium sp. 4228-Ro]
MRVRMMDTTATSYTGRQSTPYIPETIHAIVNPAAGSGRPARIWPAVRQRLERLGLRIHEAQTAEPGAAMHLARSCVKSGARELLVVGGDGTVNEVVNGILDEHGQLLAPVTLTIVPCGTGRDFARLFGITRAEQVIELLRDGEPCRVDVGQITFTDPDGVVRRRYFVNMADIGLGAETAASVSSSTKQLGGFLAYLVAAFRTILRHAAAELTLEIDGEPVFAGRASMVAIANGRFHAGGMRIAPTASVTDGIFEIFLLRETPRRVLIGSLLPAVYRGSHVRHPAVLHWSGSRVRVTAPCPVRIEIDGEPVGRTDIEARVVPRALTIRVPVGACRTA